MRLESVYISCGVNRSPGCLAWRGDKVLYASNHSIVLCQPSGNQIEAKKTLFSHFARVNCVKFMENSEEFFLSASADGTAAIWRGNEVISTLEGHKGVVTSISGLKVNEGEFIIATTSEDSTLRIWTLKDSSLTFEEVDLGRGLAFEVKVLTLSNRAIVLAGTDDSKITIFGEINSKFGVLQKLSGS